MNFGRARLLLLSVLALMALSVACGGDDDGDEAAVVTLILSPSPNANHAGVYLAQQKGYFTEENLTVNIEFSADPESAMRAVGAETKDFVIGNQLTLLKLRDEEVSVMGIAAITQHALHGIVAPASAGVENPLDLVGMKVGYPGTTNSERFLNTMLVSDGANGTQDVELVSFESGLTEALLNGTVDAIMSPDWPHAQAEADNQGQPVTVLRFKGWSLPEHYEHMLVTSERNFKKRENLVRRFTRAIRRGYESDPRVPGRTDRRPGRECVPDVDPVDARQQARGQRSPLLHRVPQQVQPHRGVRPPPLQHLRGTPLTEESETDGPHTPA